MKIYDMPEEFQKTLPPFIMDWDEAAKAEEEHQTALKEWLVQNGYDGQNTGRVYQEPAADGYARYMYADRKGAPILIHLPYGDGWHARNIEFIPAKEILKRIEMQERADAYLEKMKGNARHV